MRLRERRVLAQSVLLLSLASVLVQAVLLPAGGAAQACPADKYCFYVPPGLPLEASHSLASSRSFDIVLSSPVRPVAATYAIAGGGVVPLTIVPGTSQRIPLTASGPASAYGVAEQSGVFLVADSPNLTVDHRETFDQEQYSETIKHSAIALGTRFRLAGYSLNLEQEPLAGVDAVVVYAPSGGLVTLSAPAGATLPFWSGSATASFDATLSAGQTLAVRTVVGRDIDGALLTASAPVAVSTGGRGWSENGCGDDGMDGLVPTSALGREHVVRLPTGSDLVNGESRVRVVADFDGTEVRVNGTLVTTLAAGAFHGFQATALSYVQTSRPALVWMNGSLNGCELDTVLIPPIAFAPALTELSLDFNVLTSSQTPSAELAILIVQSQVASLRLDGVAPTLISSEAVPGRPDLAYLRFHVSPGDHNVRAGADFQAMLASRTLPSGLLAYYNPYRIPGCGDGALDPGEGCDDGNVTDRDGCSQSCGVEPGYACTGSPSSCSELCGNGVVSAPAESCDDGNLAAGDGCNLTCRREVAIVTPAAGSILPVAQPLVVGTADPLASLSVSFGSSAGTVLADAQGAWSFSPSTGLEQGTNTILVSATDTRGGVSMAARDVTIDGTTILTIESPAPNETLGELQPTIVGSAEPGATVELVLDGESIAIVVVPGDGRFAVQVPRPLSNGAHGITARSQDIVGNQASETLGFRVDARSGPLLLIYNLPDGAFTGDPRPLFSGAADPGAWVIVTLDGVTLDSLVATARGSWSLGLLSQLTAGEHELRAETSDEQGRSVLDVHRFTFEQSTTAISIEAPPAGAVLREPRPVITGTAGPGAHVQVEIDGAVVGDVDASAEGVWSLALPTALGDGHHRVRARASDEALQDGSVESGFYVDSATFVALRAPAAGATVGTPLPTIVGRAEPLAIVTITVDGDVVGQVDVADDGSFLLVLTRPLTAGEHRVRAHATDQLGNEADAEQPFRYDPGSPDSDGDGRLDAEECLAEPCPDSDGDGLSDPLDADDDGDGLATALECSRPPCLDSDADGRPDWRDADDDADGRPTLEEQQTGRPRDTDRDGRPDHQDADDDGDGLPTAQECRAAPCPDSDADSRPDWLDPDDDNDGIPTGRERIDGTRASSDDADGDGISNWLDPDANDNGIDDASDGTDDLDADEIPNYLDPDAQGGLDLEPAPPDPPAGTDRFTVAGGGGCRVGGPPRAPLELLVLGLLLLGACGRRRRAASTLLCGHPAELQAVTAGGGDARDHLVGGGVERGVEQLPV